MPGYGILEADQGKGLLPWRWAIGHLVDARTYWVSTTRPDGRPHSMPVWGVWLDDGFYFSTGPQSLKARNLAVNPNCVVGVQAGDTAIIVEGAAVRVNDPVRLQQFARDYSLKYNWDMQGFAEPVYAVRPAVAFGFISGTGEFTASATRWVFR